MKKTRLVLGIGLALAAAPGCSTIYDMSHDQTLFGGTRHNLSLFRENGCETGGVWIGVYDFLPSVVGDIVVLPFTVPVALCRAHEDD